MRLNVSTKVVQDQAAAWGVKPISNQVQNRRKILRRLSLLVAVLISLSSTSTLFGDEDPSVTFLNSGKVLPDNLPFSEAVRVGNTIYLSGQIGLLPGTLSLVEGGISKEAKQTMENIKTTLEAHDLSMSHIVKCTVMMADISKWSIFNEIYKTYFTNKYPARSTFGANGLALGAQVEVECIAIDG